MAQANPESAYLQEDHQVSYSNREIIEMALTEEEEIEAIYKAKEKKYKAKLLEDYSKKLSEMYQPRILGAYQLACFVKSRSEQKDAEGIIHGTTVTFTPEIERIFELLCFYFTGHPDFEKAGEGYSLKKGIMIYGNVGCGKTFLMDLFRDNHMNSYRIISCDAISKQYQLDGAEEIRRHYTEKQGPSNIFNQNRFGSCYDDLGTENVKKHFGNDLNVMADIMLARYNNPILKGRTHITTNLTMDEIGTMYGDRVRSRLREMVNLISFPLNAIDRRK